MHKKTATALALTAVKNEDQREFAKLVESFKNQYNEGARVNWGERLHGGSPSRGQDCAAGVWCLGFMPSMPSGPWPACALARGLTPPCLLARPRPRPRHAGGHILGMKSMHKQKKRERAVARELAQRAGV